MAQLEHTKCVCWKLSCLCCCCCLCCCLCCCCCRYHKGFLIIAPNYNRQSLAYTHTSTHTHTVAHACVCVSADTNCVYAVALWNKSHDKAKLCVAKGFRLAAVDSASISAHAHAPMPRPQPLAGSVFGFASASSLLFQLVVCFQLVCCNLIRHCLPHAFFIVSDDTFSWVSAEISVVPLPLPHSFAASSGLSYCCAILL